MAWLSTCIAVGPDEEFTSLCRTLESIIRQGTQSVEVVIKVVGQHLSEEISLYSQTAPDHRIVLLTGDDTGIYDAFNICALASSGRYLIFLGCGDKLADSFVAEDIEQKATVAKEPDFMYGSVLIANARDEITSTFDNSCFFGQRPLLPWRNPCHSQGLIYRREWLINNPFSVTIGPLADLVHTYRHSVHCRALWLSRPISIFRWGGASNLNTESALRGRLRGFLENCSNFKWAPVWRVISYMVWRLHSLLGR